MSKSRRRKARFPPILAKPVILLEVIVHYLCITACMSLLSNYQHMHFDPMGLRKRFLC